MTLPVKKGRSMETTRGAINILMLTQDTRQGMQHLGGKMPVGYGRRRRADRPQRVQGRFATDTTAGCRVEMTLQSANVRRHVFTQTDEYGIGRAGIRAFDRTRVGQDTFRV